MRLPSSHKRSNLTVVKNASKRLLALTTRLTMHDYRRLAQQAALDLQLNPAMKGETT